MSAFSTASPSLAPAEPIPLVPLPDLDRFDTSLPTTLTSFLGREREIDQICASLRRHDVRLVTLTGPGGVGKTRLALRVAEEIRTAFADGVAFVALAPIADPDLVIPTIAQALGLREVGDRPMLVRLVALLRDRTLLLVLDNVEHLLPAAPLLIELLVAAPKLTLLVTSRVVLRLSAEHVFPVPPLSVDRGAVAGRLFVERARAAQPDFDPGDGRAVAEICYQLDGLPLAIELAAARVALFPPAALLARLEHRLPLLGAGPRDVPARLRTMRGAIAWSYDLLSADEQALFRRLAVFVGGCTLDAAEAVCGGQESGELLTPNVLDGLAALLDQSLLQRVSGGRGEPRYGMLETIREFGLEQLALSGEEDLVRQCHAEFFLAAAEQAALTLEVTSDVDLLVRMDADHDNFRAALAWLTRSGDWGRALRLAGALTFFWYYHGYLAEGRRRLEQVLAAAPPDDVSHARARARALVGLGLLVQIEGDLPRAINLFSEAIPLCEQVADRTRAAMAENFLGGALVGQGAYEAARPHIQRALDAHLAAGNLGWTGNSIFHLGVIAFAAGDFDQAAACCTDAWSRFDAEGAYLDSIDPIRYLGLIACVRGDVAGAAKLLTDNLARLRELNSPAAIGNGLADVATLAATRGDLASAARLFGAAEAICRTAGVVLTMPTRATYERIAARVRAALGDAAYRDLFAAGTELSLLAALGEAEVLLAAVPDTQVRGAPSIGPEGLTEREREILRLLVAGWSNPQIADALYIARTTVRTHVSHILAKLGVRTRTEAADYAHRHHLV